MAAGIIVATAVATRMGLPFTTYLTVNVAYSYLCGLFGGYLSAVIARHRGTLHGAALGVVMVLMGLLSGAEAGRNQPRWYPAVVTFGGAAFAAFGGYVCSRLRRAHSAGHYHRPGRSTHGA